MKFSVKKICQILISYRKNEKYPVINFGEIRIETLIVLLSSQYEISFKMNIDIFNNWKFRLKLTIIYSIYIYNLSDTTNSGLLWITIFLFEKIYILKCLPKIPFFNYEVTSIDILIRNVIVNFICEMSVKIVYKKFLDKQIFCGGN